MILTLKKNLFEVNSNLSWGQRCQYKARIWPLLYSKFKLKPLFNVIAWFSKIIIFGLPYLEVIMNYSKKNNGSYDFVDISEKTLLETSQFLFNLQWNPLIWVRIHLIDLLIWFLQHFHILVKLGFKNFPKFIKVIVWPLDR